MEKQWKVNFYGFTSFGILQKEIRQIQVLFLEKKENFINGGILGNTILIEYKLFSSNDK